MPPVSRFRSGDNTHSSQSRCAVLASPVRCRSCEVYSGSARTGDDLRGGSVSLGTGAGSGTGLSLSRPRLPAESSASSALARTRGRVVYKSGAPGADGRVAVPSAGLAACRVPTAGSAWRSADGSVAAGARSPFTFCRRRRAIGRGTANGPAGSGVWPTRLACRQAPASGFQRATVVDSSGGQPPWPRHHRRCCRESVSRVGVGARAATLNIRTTGACVPAAAEVGEHDAMMSSSPVSFRRYHGG